MEEARVACVDYVFIRSGASVVVVLLLNIPEYVYVQVVAHCDSGLRIHRTFALLAQVLWCIMPMLKKFVVSSDSKAYAIL